MVVVKLWEGTAEELAWIDTVPPDGMETGAMKVVGSPLAVCRVMEPQSDAVGLAQVRSQLTPRLAGSLLTVAANCVEELAATEEGGAMGPDAKARVVGKLFVTPHPVDSRTRTHKTNRSRPGLEHGAGRHQTDSRFISIFSTSVNR